MSSIFIEKLSVIEKQSFYSFNKKGLIVFKFTKLQESLSIINTIDQKNFDIYLNDTPEASTKMKTIGLIREIAKIELKAAKTLVEKAPTIIKSGLTLDEVENIKKKFDAIGVKIDIKENLD